MVLTHIAWAAIVTSASMVSYDLQVKSVAYSSTLSVSLNPNFNRRTGAGTTTKTYCNDEKVFFFAAALFAAVSFSACSDDDKDDTKMRRSSEHGRLHVRSAMKLCQERVNSIRI